MAQVTIYLDAELEAAVRERAKAEGLSLSAYIAQILREKENASWPPGFWENFEPIPDFPLAEEIRATFGEDAPRVPFDDEDEDGATPRDAAE